MTEASATSNAENVKLQIEESREDSTEVSSRMEDVLPSRKRGSEEGGFPEDPMLEGAGRVGNVRQPDGSDLCVAGVWLWRRVKWPICCRKQLWRNSCRHGYRARHRCGLRDRLEHG